MTDVDPPPGTSRPAATPWPTGLPHRFLADELMLRALEFDEVLERDDAERERLLAAAQVQATLAMVEILDGIRATLSSNTAAAGAWEPGLVVLDAHARRRRKRQEQRDGPAAEGGERPRRAAAH